MSNSTLRAGRTAFHLAVAFAALFELAPNANAALNRFVSTAGVDAGNCSPAAPCRNLQFAVNIASPGSEVIVLNSGGYGHNLTINKSITIAADHVVATFTEGIVIDNPTAVVALRGLALNGGGATDAGISIRNAAAVHIENCIVERFVGDGIQSTARNSEIFVINSISRDNGAAGLSLTDNGPVASGSIDLTIDNSQFLNNGGDGLLLTNLASVTLTRNILAGNRANGMSMAWGTAVIRETTASQNRAMGFYFLGANATVESSVFFGNSTGLLAGGEPDTTIVTISNSAFTNNGTGVAENGATIFTRGNNTIVDNGDGPDDNVFGTLTPLAGQ